MNLGEIARQWYEENEPEGALAATILRCFFFGTIIRKPNLLLIGETCRSDGEKIIDGHPPNCWWIHFWAAEKGSMSSYDLCLEAPYRLEWVAFKRRGKIHVVRWEKLYWKDFRIKPQGGHDYGRSTLSRSAETA